MDDHNAKRPFGGRLSAARRGPGLAFRDASNPKDRSVQCCNRLGCSTRLNPVKGSQVGTSDTAKSSKPSFRSTSSKSMIGCSSKRYSAVRDVKKPQQAPQKVVPSETINPRVVTEVSRGISSTVSIHAGLSEPEDVKPGVPNEFSVDESGEGESYREISNAKDQKKIRERSKLGNQDTLGSSRRSITSKNISQVAKKSTPQGQVTNGTSASKYGLRNLRCTSISDVLPAGCSSSHLSRSRKTEVTKRSPDGDCSVRGKISRSSSGESSGTIRNSLSHGNFHSDYPVSQRNSSRTGNRPSNKNVVASIRTPTVNGGNRARISGRGKGNSRSLVDSPAVPPRSPQTESSVSGSSASYSSHLSLAELPMIRRISFEGVGSGSVRNRVAAHTEDGTAHSFHDLSTDRHGFRRTHMDGIDEVLFALEMIEQDEELTHEQLYFLESNLFLSGLSFHDQHRDMRLDIDNMSYEELLALEEKIGTVSTALTEETLADCVKKSYYMSSSSFDGNTRCGEDDVKCSICQEEYADGDEVGKLQCDHGYHVACIHHWLRQKNWCPICKNAAAVPS